MLFRRLVWWLNGADLDRAIAQLNQARILLDQQSTQCCQWAEQLRAEHQRLKEFSDRLGAPPAMAIEQVVETDPLKLWLQETILARHGGGPVARSHQVNLDEAVHDLAQAIRTSGVPLSPGLRASAGPGPVLRVVQGGSE